MGLHYSERVIEMSPGLVDVHGHPRVFDAIVDQALTGLEEHDGKAGLISYTETALQSGLTVVNAMPNEFIRTIDPDDADISKILQYPISNRDRAMAMEASLQTQSQIRMSYYLGLDRSEILERDGEILNSWTLRRNFHEAGERTKALKIFGDESTGGQQIPIQHIPEIIAIWHVMYPDKPVILHLEDANVGAVLEGVYNTAVGLQVPLHIAHVSSPEELVAVLIAKENMGMNVTCEVTPHHLFADSDSGALIGGYGCMKPTLKTPEEAEFLRENIDVIDIIASDCAPHKVSDKEAVPPTYGVTNHTVMMPLLFGAMEDGWLTPEQIYEKMVVNPRLRFNLPEKDGTVSVFDLTKSYVSAQEAEADINPAYGQNIFPKLEELGQKFHLVGKLVFAQSGASTAARTEDGTWDNEFRTNLRHLVV